MFFCSSKINACDICGCGIGGNYIGILPDFHKHIIGLRYRLNSLRSHIGTNGSNTYLTTTEKYITTELWGGWNIGKKFRVMLSVPYGFNERNNLGTVKNKDGIGDISTMAYYQLVNKRSTTFRNNLMIQSLWIGGGIKLPTGKYSPEDKANTSQNTNLFQLGTASTDFNLNAMYDTRLQDGGFNISANYKMNTANKYNYRYGNKLNASAQWYYKFRVKKSVTLAPNLGLMYETAAKDHDNLIPVDMSGGFLIGGTIGLETTFKKISIGANLQRPWDQHLANGSVKANNRVMIHLSFML